MNVGRMTTIALGVAAGAGAGAIFYSKMPDLKQQRTSAGLRAGLVGSAAFVAVTSALMGAAHLPDPKMAAVTVTFGALAGTAAGIGAAALTK